MNITTEQKNILKKYGIKYSDDIDNIDDVDYINELLLALDAKIIEIGFNSDYSLLNEVGLKLQRLYDQLYYQN